MNNPVNMWDPTGHVPVPTWVGDDTHLDINGNAAIKHELLSSSSSNSGWYNIGTVDNGKEIIYKYQATITKTWVYKRYLGLYDERIDDFKFIFGHNVTYSQTDYYFDDVVVPASKIAEESEKAIQELVGNPPKNTDPPIVSINTLQVGSGPVQLLNPDQVIVQNTGKKTTGSQSIVTGAVQSVLNNLFNKGLDVDGWYGSKTAGAISEFQKEHQLTVNGKLDVKTFYQLESLLPNPKSIPTLATNQDPEGGDKGTGNATSSMFGKSSYLKEIEKIEKKSGYWAAMNKIMDDINDNHEAFINEDYNKVLDLYNKIDSYAKLIIGGEAYSNSQREEVHYFRNQLNRAPASLEELGKQSSDWKLLSAGKSIFHMQGENGLKNLKFVSVDGRFEAVYNEEGELVTDSINMGSYNYAPSTTEGSFMHYTYDVDPYYKWGNTSDSSQKGFLEISFATISIKDQYDGDKRAQKHRQDIIKEYNFVEVD
jgi:hypothetical protein